MTQHFQTVLQGVRALSKSEQQALLELLSRDLEQPSSLIENTLTFWEAASLEELVANSPVSVVTDIRGLALDFWPKDESADELNKFVAQRRHHDRLQEA
jgi:hypothetical protein